MPTLPARDTTSEVVATTVRFADAMLYVVLSDGREIGMPLALPWLAWLAQATPEQRAAWRLEPGGWAIYWDDLDDGIEVAHLLSPHALGGPR